MYVIRHGGLILIFMHGTRPPRLPDLHPRGGASAMSGPTPRLPFLTASEEVCTCGSSPVFPLYSWAPFERGKRQVSLERGNCKDFESHKACAGAAALREYPPRLPHTLFPVPMTNRIPVHVLVWFLPGHLFCAAKRNTEGVRPTSQKLLL